MTDHTNSNQGRQAPADFRAVFFAACIELLRLAKSVKAEASQILPAVNAAKMMWGVCVCFGKLDREQRGAFDSVYAYFKGLEGAKYVGRSSIIAAVELNKARYGHLMQIGVPRNEAEMLEMLGAGRELYAREHEGERQLGFLFLALADYASCVLTGGDGIALAFAHAQAFEEAIAGRQYGRGNLVDAAALVAAGLKKTSPNWQEGAASRPLRLAYWVESDGGGGFNVVRAALDSDGVTATVSDKAPCVNPWRTYRNAADGDHAERRLREAVEADRADGYAVYVLDEPPADLARPLAAVELCV